MLNNRLDSYPKKKRSSPATTQSKRRHVQSFESSNKTMTAYCKEHEIAISTFSTWVSKYGVKDDGVFLPIQTHKPIPTSASMIETQQPAHIEIHRGELKVILPILSDAKVAIEIIKGVLSCN